MAIFIIYSTMKQLFLLGFLICLAINCSGQKIHFTDTSNVWWELKYQYDDWRPAIKSYSSFSYAKDTTIDSTRYKCFGFGIVREDTVLKKVYLRDVSGDSEVLLMD